MFSQLRISLHFAIMSKGRALSFATNDTDKIPADRSRLRPTFFFRLNCSFQMISTGMIARAKSKNAQ